MTSRESKIQIVDMYSLSDTKPVSKNNTYIISRDPLLDLFDSQFEEEKVLCVTGEEGVGVTTTLNMFAKKHRSCCASYFYNGWSRHLLSPQAIAYSLLKQLSWYTKQDFNVEFDGSSLSSCVYKLSRASKNKAKYLYFVFDGFNRLPLEYLDGIKHLISPLFAIDNVRFIFSGTLEEIKPLLPDNILAKQSNEILKFQLNDVQGYLRNILPEISEEEMEIIYDLSSKGLARKLSIINEKIQRFGIDKIHELSYNMVDDFYEEDLEWIKSGENTTRCLLLALLTYSERPINRVALTSMLKLTNGEIDKVISECGHYIREEEGFISITSSDFRKYLYNKLRNYKNEIELLLIEWIEGGSDASEQFLYLPPLYKHVKGDKSLVTYLTTDKVQHFLEQKKSQAALNEQCDYGFNACSDFNSQASAYFRFAINRSMSREIEKNELSDSELEALLAVGDVDTAFNLTQQVFLLEERLKCLLIMARFSHRLSEGMNEEIHSQIKLLADAIDYAHIPDKALELAKLMMPVMMQKALEIIEIVAKVTKDQTQIDRLYTAISLTYLNEGVEDNNTAKADLVSTKIVDKDLQQMTSVMKSIMKDSKSVEVITKMKDLPPTSQLYFLSYWIPDHRDRNDIGDAVEYAVRLVIDTSNTIMPKVSLLRSFCMPLPKMSLLQITSVVDLLDAIVTNIKFPTTEYVQLMLLVISAVAKHDPLKAGHRLQDLYLEILDLCDTALKAHCKSFILREYENLGKKEDIEQLLSTAYSLQKEIKADILKVLDESAYHLKVVEGPIRVLICTAPTLVEEIIEKMNTSERKNRAYLLAVTEYVKQVDIAAFDWKFFLKIFNKIDYDKSELYKPIYELTKKITDISTGDARLLSSVEKFYFLFKKIEQIEVLCYCLSLIYTWVAKNYSAEDFKLKIAADLKTAWESINVPWLKVNTGYNISKILSGIPLKVEAREYIAHTAKIRSHQLLSSLSCVTAYEQSLDLYAHSLGILIRASLYETNDLEQFKLLLDYEANEEDAIILWSQIALEFFGVGNLVQFNSIVSQYVSIDLSKYPLDTQKRILYNISPAIYLTSPSLFYSRINGFDRRFYNACVENVGKYIQTKYPYPEYVSSNEIDSQVPLAQSDYDKLLDLVEHSYDEEFIFNLTDVITKTVDQNLGKLLSREHQRVIFTRLEGILKTKLPLKGGIQHEGYLISCQAMVESRKPGGNISGVTFQERIEKVSNKADQAFLFAHVSGCLKKVSEKAAFLDKSMAVTADIDYFFDRYNRYCLCVQESLQNVKTKSRTLVTKVMDSLKSDSNGSYSDYQRIFDLVRDKDEQLADSLLERLDDDPSRVQYKKKLQLRMQSRKKIEDAKKDLLQVRKLNLNEQMRFFARQMESLIKKKNVVRDINSTQYVVSTIYSSPITDIHNAVLYFLENLYQKNSSNGKYRTLLREIHNSMRYNLKLVLAIASGTKEKLERVNRIYEEEYDTNDGMIYKGQSDKGLKRIIDWYSSHPFDTIRIIDPYFHPEDLFIIKHLMNINNDLKCSILTNNDSGEDINDVFQKGWLKISDEITGRIEIRSCSYEENPGSSPWHDRWWVVYDSETDTYNGIRLASPSTLGVRISEISQMDETSINSANLIFNRFFINMQLRYEGKRLYYEETKLR